MKKLVEIRSQEFICRERALRDSEHKIFWLAQAEEWTLERGYDVVALRSNVIRDRAHAFYLREGYTHAKTQKAFRKTLKKKS